MRRPASITGGELKGVRLVVPPKIRATEAKVRLALFNILGDFIEGARVLDGFAGSGALGLEALSRGAAFAAFIDSDADSIIALRDNLAQLDQDVPRQAWRVMQAPIEAGMRELSRTELPFDVIVLDPPYRSEEGKKALNSVVQYAMLAPAGIVGIEHDQRTVFPSTIGPLQQYKQHRYGDTVLSFYR